MEFQRIHDRGGFRYTCDSVAEQSGLYRGRVILLERLLPLQKFEPPMPLLTYSCFKKARSAQIEAEAWAIEITTSGYVEYLIKLQKRPIAA